MILGNLANELRAHGLKVVEVAGWQNRGYLGRDLIEMRGVVWHHTATNRNAFNGNNMPTLNMLTHGRSDVAGPLSQLGLGRDGTVYVCAAGLSNHAGAGFAFGIPRDMGNYYLLGVEMESSGIAPWDWTSEQLYWAPRLGAALERIYLQRLPEEQRLQIAHYEYSSQGKIDPAGWPGGMDGLRNSINSILAGSSAPAPKPQPAPTPAPTPAPAPQPTGKVPYCTVDPGDTLYAISRQFGVPLDKILAYNPGINPNALSVGQRVYLVNHCFVDPGDTYYSIAKQFGYTVAQLTAWNPGTNPNTLKVGQALWLE